MLIWLLFFFYFYLLLCMQPVHFPYHLGYIPVSRPTGESSRQLILYVFSYNIRVNPNPSPYAAFTLVELVILEFLA